MVMRLCRSSGNREYVQGEKGKGTRGGLKNTQGGRELKVKKISGRDTRLQNNDCPDDRGRPH